MRMADAFVNVRAIAPTRALEEAESQNTAPQTNSQGVFVDPKTLVSFPIATAVASTISQVLVGLSGEKSPLIGLVVALAIGGLIFAITMSDANARPTTRMGWAVASGIALINSLLLYAAMVGIGQLKGTQS